MTKRAPKKPSGLGWQTGGGSLDFPDFSKLAEQFDFPRDFNLALKLEDAFYTKAQHASIFPKATTKKIASYFARCQAAATELREVIKDFGPIPRQIAFGSGVSASALNKLLSDLDQRSEEFQMTCASIGSRVKGVDKRGRKGDPGLKRLIFELIVIWDSAFGPNTSTNGTYGGPFFDFVKAVMKVIGIRPHSDESLGKKIARVRGADST